MIIYGHSGQDIRRAIWRRRYKFISVFAVIVVAVMLTGCGTANKNTNAMSEFFKAIGSGDLSVIKEKFKDSKEKDDGSWDEVVQDSTGVE